MAEPTPRNETGLDGLHITVAPAGAPVARHVASAATLGPLLTQVTVPLTVLPAGGLAGKPLIVACISACAVTAIGLVSTLLAGTPSAVSDPAVVVMFSGPLAGAVKVEVQVITPFKGRGLGVGAGVQLVLAPGGRPESVQAGSVASIGPLLVHVPDTVTDWPAATAAGTVVAAAISASGAVLVLACARLLLGVGSGVEELATPVMVTGRALGGPLKLT